MQREVLVNQLIDLLCKARECAADAQQQQQQQKGKKNRKKGRPKASSSSGATSAAAVVKQCFADGMRLVDEIRDQTAELIDAVRFWQQAYVEAPPFRFERHPNYLTHIIVSLDFVHSFPAFRKLLHADARRNPFMIPNARPTGDLKRWAKFHEYHQSLLRLESRAGRAEVPARKKVARCIAGTTAKAGDADLSKARDAEAAAAALKKKRKADEKYLAKIAAKEAEIQEQRLVKVRACVRTGCMDG